MVLPHRDGDLYHRYRPLRFQEIVGHKEVIKSIKTAVLANRPSQAYLLTGSSGTGKTTTARIMALVLNCLNKDESNEPCLSCEPCKAVLSGRCIDIVELNAADNRGIDAIRSLCEKMRLMPLQLKNKVYILDEAHQLTNDAQSSLLKELEEAPKHVYIILCTTHPDKLIPTVRNRCQRFDFKPLKRKEVFDLLSQVSTYETFDFSEDVFGLIADKSEGSPRAALVLLQQVSQLESSKIEDVSKLVFSEDSGNESVFSLCSLLERRADWGKVSKVYNECRDTGAPTLSMLIAGYFRNKLLKNGLESYGQILELFCEPLPEGKVGENMLVSKLFKAHKTLSAKAQFQKNKYGS